jgi:hypothetical protein
MTLGELLLVAYLSAAVMVSVGIARVSLRLLQLDPRGMGRTVAFGIRLGSTPEWATELTPVLASLLAGLLWPAVAFGMRDTPGIFAKLMGGLIAYPEDMDRLAVRLVQRARAKAP